MDIKEENVVEKETEVHLTKVVLIVPKAEVIEIDVRKGRRQDVLLNFPANVFYVPAIEKVVTIEVGNKAERIDVAVLNVHLHIG